MAKPSVITATVVKPGDRISERIASLSSCIFCSWLRPLPARAFTLTLLKPLFDAQNDSRSKTEVVMEVTSSEIWNVVELRA